MRELFDLDPSLVFLNHGSFGACPRPVRDAQRAWQDAMECNPVEFLGRRSAALLRAAREKLAAFVGASADDLVFVPNATTGVNIVAQSLTLRPGDEVLGTTLEYGACDATWDFVCARQGASYRRAAIALPLDDEAFVDAVMSAVNARTRLVFVSHIASTTALVLPVAALVKAAHARGLPVLVDGAHAPGQLDLSLDALGADFYTGNGHKWLCGPKGSGFLHARREHHEWLQANVISWGYLQGGGGHTGFDAYLGESGFERRLQWQGTRDISGFLALPAAIDFHREHLGSQVRRACHAQAVALMHELATHFGLPVIGSDAHFAQMAAIPIPLGAEGDAEALRQRLFDRHRIEVPVTQHEGRAFVRVSVQGYNRPSELEALAAALREALADG
ncbi:MAG TPA: aminotransferase class V-fold PLP-dependent enzyme [Rubrivivax sp.]|nr:aminotransferase class V-fold PLP-dependent enzyme [Rubrivivax sp.]